MDQNCIYWKIYLITPATVREGILAAHRAVLDNPFHLLQSANYSFDACFQFPTKCVFDLPLFRFHLGFQISACLLM